MEIEETEIDGDRGDRREEIDGNRGQKTDTGTCPVELDFRVAGVT